MTMENTDKELESMILPTVWTAYDSYVVALSKWDEKHGGHKPIHELPDP